MRNQKGITLIALVITIIVLLILAGVSIAMLTGENGILNQATNATDETKIGEQKEDAMLQASELVSKYYEEKYAKSNSTVEATAGAYVKAQFEAKEGSYTYSSPTITLSAESRITGAIQDDGTIKWTDARS